MSSFTKILCRTAYYGIQGTGAVLLTGCTVSNTFRQQVDSHLISPWRNYHYTLSDKTHFCMPEDLCQFKTELSSGMCKFISYTTSGFASPKE